MSVGRALLLSAGHWAVLLDMSCWLSSRLLLPELLFEACRLERAFPAMFTTLIKWKKMLMLFMLIYFNIASFS